MIPYSRRNGRKLTVMENNPLSAVQLAVTSAAITGDSGALYQIVARLLGDGVPFEDVLFGLLIPSEQDVGVRWQQGDYLIAEEHAATATVETVVAILAGSFDQPSDGRHIVVGTPEGEAHSLPSRAIAAHLLSLGYRATYLGASLPASDLGEYLEVEGPEALVLSSVMSIHLPGARKSIRASHAAEIPVLVGGNAFGPNGTWATKIGADGWVDRLQDVPKALSVLSREVSKSEENARDIDTEMIAMGRARASIVARAHAALSNSPLGEDPSRMTDEVNLLFDAVVAAMLVEDAAIVADMVRWQSETLESHGFGSTTALTEALREAIEPVSEMAALLIP